MGQTLIPRHTTSTRFDQTPRENSNRTFFQLQERRRIAAREPLVCFEPDLNRTVSVRYPNRDLALISSPRNPRKWIQKCEKMDTDMGAALTTTDPKRRPQNTSPSLILTAAVPVSKRECRDAVGHNFQRLVAAGGNEIPAKSMPVAVVVWEDFGRCSRLFDLV